jgi:transcription initiation factor TFIIIB Brf1 subunit/transcription initiation factor TFIIB
MCEKVRKCDLRIQAEANRNLSATLSQLAILKDKLGLSDAIIEKTVYIHN